MGIRDINTYISILKKKAKEMLDLLPEVDPSTTQFRDLIINFNNTFSNIQQYKMLVKELEEEKNNLTDAE